MSESDRYKGDAVFGVASRALDDGSVYGHHWAVCAAITETIRAAIHTEGGASPSAMNEAIRKSMGDMA